MSSDRDKYPSETAERFQVRLPAGLRDRIKAYAEKHGRSMNTEIVRVLENEFPPPWSVEDRIEQLLGLLNVMKGSASNEAVGKFVDEVDETIRGIITGRIRGFTEDQKKHVARIFAEYDLERAADGDPTFNSKDLDEEELQAFDLTGTTQKFVHPPEDK